ncbi:unnamed protein product [Prorocentrum cordatum]|uniref:Uncharacterized protein n=1 Tax=Prorocentrum cordatum TaxID=2364126 RepID=A0ABN9R5X6_9DINO|nr:unnamed protein product [Polarella glacialis]
MRFMSFKDSEFSGDLYEMSTFMHPPAGGWLSTADCFGRALRVVLAFYVLLASQPLELYSFLVKYHQVFHWGGWIGWSHLIMFVSLTMWPGLVILLVCHEKLKTALRPPSEVNCFFVEPENFFARCFWAFQMVGSVPLAIFMTHGNSTAAIENAWHDYVLTKQFWRRHMEKTNMPFPQQLGQWDGSSCDWWSHAKGKSDDFIVGDVVLKLMDGCLGAGDTFLEAGRNGFDGTLGAVSRVLNEKYASTVGVLVLEWVRPKSGHEVHSFDIVTMVMPDDSIQLVSCLYWGNCRDGGSSTHDAMAGFVVDVDEEKVHSTASWYSALFAKSMGAGQSGLAGQGTGHGEVGLGSHFPGIKELCKQAIKGHESALQETPWLHVVGWDAMFSTSGPVFFEGNYASHRIPRRVFLTWRSTVWFLSNSKRFSFLQSRRGKHITV